MEAMMTCLSTSCSIKVMTKTNTKLKKITIERFSFEYRKTIGFALVPQHHWLKKIRATFSSNQY